LNKYLSEQTLLAVFRQFDTDNSGQLTPQNIKYAMQKLGYEVDLADIKTIVT
jgi:Ca2+-binding EF-hand superfamily protein